MLAEMSCNRPARPTLAAIVHTNWPVAIPAAVSSAAASSAGDRVADGESGIGPRRADHQCAYTQEGQHVSHHSQSSQPVVKPGSLIFLRRHFASSMSSGADSPDSEPRISFQDLSDPVPPELQRLPSGPAKRGKRLDRDLNPPAGSSLMQTPATTPSISMTG
jgi:hypothetical protein